MGKVLWVRAAAGPGENRTDTRVPAAHARGTWVCAAPGAGLHAGQEESD